jgi:hypothetical protein
VRYFDGVANNTIFCTWTGDNPLTPNRINALFTIFSNTQCPVAFLNLNSLRRWEVAEEPFHPAFEFLSATHKSDYLRIYLMYHFGGGYTDIKITAKSWSGFFERLKNSSAFGIGYTEIGPGGVAAKNTPEGMMLRTQYQHIIGCCAFIFKRKTEFTHELLRRQHQLMDEMLPSLKAFPARHPMDRLGLEFPDTKEISRYPLPWSFFGETFHPLVFEFKDHILHDDMLPVLHSYR